jgi:hypothetical protein
MGAAQPSELVRRRNDVDLRNFALSEQLGVPPLPPVLHLRETTPPLDERVLEFCRKVGIAAPVMLRVSPTEGAEVGWCIRNVECQIDRHGGSIEYGWISWSAHELFYEAEFHAVWHRPDHVLIDVTPQRDGEAEMLFSPSDVADDFNFYNDRPGNRRWKAYRRPDLDQMVSEKLATMTEASQRYAREKAAKKGLSLNDWIASRIEGDPFDRAIARFIELGDKVDEMVKPSVQGASLRKGVSRTEFSRVVDELTKAKLKVWTMCEGMVMQSIAEEQPSVRP